MPSEGVTLSPKQNILTTPEILKLSKIFVSLGVTKIKLTGGEPTVRKDLVDIVKGLNELRPLGLQSIGITTNGIALTRKLELLKNSGLILQNFF
jgi:cyclic pyranopterin phosphate synthase